MTNASDSKAGKVTIKIPRQLYEKISETIEGAGYNSVTDFVVYVMRDLIASHIWPGRTGRFRIRWRRFVSGFGRWGIWVRRWIESQGACSWCVVRTGDGEPVGMLAEW